MSGKTCKAVSGKAGELCGLMRGNRNVRRAKGDSRNPSLDVIIRAAKQGGVWTCLDHLRSCLAMKRTVVTNADDISDLTTCQLVPVALRNHGTHFNGHRTALYGCIPIYGWIPPGSPNQRPFDAPQSQ